VSYHAQHYADTHDFVRLPTCATFQRIDCFYSKLCQHSFSKEAVDDMFKSASVRKSCPAAGCTKKLLRSDFELDEDLARKVKDYERHIARSRQDEDDGEVIE